MASTLKERIGYKELLHETLSDPLGDIEVTMEYRFICLSDKYNSVLLSVSQFEKLMGVGPRVVEKAKEVQREATA
jgi:hypothetical protein